MRSTALGALAVATIALPTATALDLDDAPGRSGATAASSTALGSTGIGPLPETSGSSVDGAAASAAGAPDPVEAVSNGAVTRVPAATSAADAVALTSGSSITGKIPGTETGGQGVVVEIAPTFTAPLENSHVTSEFGYRSHPILDRRKLHGGEDWQGACGTPVHAIADGTVTSADRHGASGKRVDLDHGDGLSTWYGHLQGYEVGVGETVQAGDVVGYVGTTGRSTGCHLHLAVSLHGSYVDPDVTVWDEAWVAGFGG